MRKKKGGAKGSAKQKDTHKGNMIAKMLREGEYFIQGKHRDPEVLLNRAEKSVPFLCE